jgi:phenylalanyl-tRNA synthetase beta chain
MVDVPVDVATLAERLHMSGFELAGVEPVTQQAGGPRSAGDAAAPDAVIDLEITANRPDCLSMAGLAREVSAIFGAALRHRPVVPPSAGDASVAGPLRVTIEDTALCPRYTAAIADIRVGQSPAWLVARLAAAGVRSINNIVDVTNYVLMETGHPLHAFDLARLAGPHLRIRRALDGERVTTLDGQSRPLRPDMLVIADADRAQAVAGVMGGADSEVSLNTTTIAIESAYFDPRSVRLTSRRLGLSTEASYRFERGADPEAPAPALFRACQLIEQIGAGTVRPAWIDARPEPRRPVQLTLRRSRITRVLGFEVPPEETVRILNALGFDARPDADGWAVVVPSWRGDVTREADLIEELARIHGYTRIPETFPALDVEPPAPAPRLARDTRLRALARAAGFSESVTFSFIEREAARSFADEASFVTLANPLSETFTVMRPVLLAGLVDSVAHNRRREQRDVRLFELANRFTREHGEHRALALACTGHAAPGHWSGSGRPADLFDMTGVVSELCAAIGLEATFVPARIGFLTGDTATAIHVAPLHAAAAGPRAIGVVGQLAPAVADARGLPAREPLFVAEIDLDAVADWTTGGSEVRATPLPRFPSIVRDISILVPSGLSAAGIRGTIRGAAPPTLERVGEFDRYQGRGVPEGSCSLSLRLTFRAPDRTLTDAEVQTAMDAVVAALQQTHGARLRQ